MLGILGVAIFGIFGPVAWILGSTANAGRLLGVVGTVIVLGAVLLFVLALVGIIEVS